MASIHEGHRGRMKKEFLARPETFPDHKLLELLLFYAIPRRDTNALAHTLLEQFGSLGGVLDALPEELQKVPGVGEHTVALLKAAKELSGRYLTARAGMDGLVGGRKDAAQLLHPYFFGARNERVCIVALDGKDKCLGVRQVGEGSVNAAEVTARKVAEAALALNATQVILAHNHVSGLALPSAEDKLTTRYLAKVLGTVGIALVDHMIFADDDMVSLRDSGFDFYGEY